MGPFLRALADPDARAALALTLLIASVALDATVRKTLRRELRHIHDAAGVATLFVTHDQAEALELADLVAVLNSGVIEQIATPQVLQAARQRVCRLLCRTGQPTQRAR